MIDWQSGLKDAMWSMFWFANTKGSPDNEADKEALKECVAWLIRATTQKVGYDAQKRGVKNAVNWKSLDTKIMQIVCLATSLCLNGEFGDMPELLEDENDGTRGQADNNSTSCENLEQACADCSGLDSQGQN